MAPPPTRKQKGKKNTENDTGSNKVVVGRKAFFRFLKIKVDERNQNEKVKKIDDVVRKEIVEEWRNLDRTQKAAFCPPNESEEVASDIGAIEVCTQEVQEQDVGIMTRCSPDRFHDVISRFSSERISILKEMGFGILAQLSCTRLHRDLCRYLVDRLDTHNSSINIHGKTLEICSSDFERIMGVPDGGHDVQLSGSMNDDDIKALTDIHCGKDRKATIKIINEKLDQIDTVGDNFRVAFMLFSLGTLLCPTSGLSVNPRYMLALRRPDEIRYKNWASYSFKFLLDAISSYKANKLHYVSGCLLFLQLYYLDAVAHGKTFVERSLCPIVAWGDLESKRLLKWVKKHGGYESSDIDVASNYVKKSGFATTKDVLLKFDGLSPEIVACIETSINGLKEHVVDVLVSHVEQLINDRVEQLINGRVDQLINDRLNIKRVE